MIQALGHWLIYLQLVKYFLPKTAEDDWFLFLLGLMQVLIGSVINQSDQVGTWLFLWAMLAVWVLGQFFLQREARRLLPATNDTSDRTSSTPLSRSLSRAVRCSVRRGDGSRHGDDAGPGRTDLSGVAAPSRARPAIRPAAPMSRHLTGFDEEVQLGQLGEILENDTVVMTVELTDDDDKTIRPAEEPLWRGVTMLRYDKGRWHRQSKPTQTVVSFHTTDHALAIAQEDPPEDQARAQRLRRPCSASARCSMRISAHRFCPSPEHQRRHAVSSRIRERAITNTR